MELNLADLFESVVETVPSRVAMVTGDSRFTYDELNERADRLAAVFQRHGVGPGDFVGIQLPNGNEYIECMLAAFKLRAVPVNVNFRYVDSELRYLYADAGLVALVHHEDFGDAVTGAKDAMA
ncbi:MAG: AMP-binding protein, partial [Microthrixaceae bacterium]|nr:AMP-binding protein [Microthrixaceae bacterium]